MIQKFIGWLLKFSVGFCVASSLCQSETVWAAADAQAETEDLTPAGDAPEQFKRQMRRKKQEIDQLNQADQEAAEKSQESLSDATGAGDLSAGVGQLDGTIDRNISALDKRIQKYEEILKTPCEGSSWCERKKTKMTKRLERMKEAREQVAAGKAQVADLSCEIQGTCRGGWRDGEGGPRGGWRRRGDWTAHYARRNEDFYQGLSKMPAAEQSAAIDAKARQDAQRWADWHGRGGEPVSEQSVARARSMVERGREYYETSSARGPVDQQGADSTRGSDSQTPGPIASGADQSQTRPGASPGEANSAIGRHFDVPSSSENGGNNFGDDSNGFGSGRGGRFAGGGSGGDNDFSKFRNPLIDRLMGGGNNESPDGVTPVANPVAGGDNGKKSGCQGAGCGGLTTSGTSRRGGHDSNPVFVSETNTDFLENTERARLMEQITQTQAQIVAAHSAQLARMQQQRRMASFSGSSYQFSNASNHSENEGEEKTIAMRKPSSIEENSQKKGEEKVLSTGENVGAVKGAKGSKKKGDDGWDDEEYDLGKDEYKFDSKNKKAEDDGKLNIAKFVPKHDPRVNFEQFEEMRQKDPTFTGAFGPDNFEKLTLRYQAIKSSMAED